MYHEHKEKRKYYHTTVFHDLLGDLVVVSSYGSKLNNHEVVRSVPVANLDQAHKVMGKISKRRKQHGYIKEN